jgi:peptidoglycan-associated lipoprotein
MVNASKIGLILCVSLMFWGCAKKQVLKPSPQVATPPSVVEQEAKAETSVRYPDWESIPQLKTIHFDYDSTNLNDEARNILKTNSEFLKSNPDMFVLVNGHCDERGTTEYNLGLGQRRASSVREYYGQLGVPLGRIGTISFGKEQPLDSGHNEDAWAKNRRVETKVRSGK